MTLEEIKTYRAQVGLSQTEMAERMGMKMRSYQDIEAGRTPIATRHVMSLERASLQISLERKDISLALPAIRRDALDYTALFRGCTIHEEADREKQAFADCAHGLFEVLMEITNSSEKLQ